MPGAKATQPSLAGRRLDIGCGLTKRGPDYVGVDLLDAPGVDIVGDARAVLGTVETGVVAEVFTSHFLEHVDDVPGMVTEIARVLRPGGRLEIVVPHFSNPYYYSDPTHRAPFGLYTLDYVAGPSHFRRRVPTYGATAPLRLESVTLEFKSEQPWSTRNRIKGLVQRAVNAHRAIQEFYEESLVYLIPCYQLRFVLFRTPVPAAPEV